MHHFGLYLSEDLSHSFEKRWDRIVSCPTGNSSRKHVLSTFKREALLPHKGDTCSHQLYKKHCTSHTAFAGGPNIFYCHAPAKPCKIFKHLVYIFCVFCKTVHLRKRAWPAPKLINVRRASISRPNLPKRHLPADEIPNFLLITPTCPYR